MFHIIKLWRGLSAAFKDPKVVSLLSFTLSLISIASVVYHYVEGWGWVDSIYFSVITISTVGYGDFSPQTETGKIFTIAYILIGLGIFVAAASALAEVLLRNREEEK